MLNIEFKNISRKIPRKSSKGFTLVEVMVVIAMTGVMSAMAVPSFKGAIQRTNANGEIIKVESFLSEARNLARTSLCTIAVDINTSANRMRIDSISTENDCDKVQSLALTLDPEMITLTQAKVSATVTNPFVYQSTGGTDYDAYGVFEIHNVVTNKKVILSVWPLIGNLERN